jgi:hypothetical protein
MFIAVLLNSNARDLLKSVYKKSYKAVHETLFGFCTSIWQFLFSLKSAMLHLSSLLEYAKKAFQSVSSEKLCRAHLTPEAAIFCPF